MTVINKPTPIWVTVLLIALAAGILYYLMPAHSNTERIIELKQIATDTVKAKFKAKVKEAQLITNRVKNEKPIIADTTDAYKREYISNYPASAAIEP